MTRAPDPRTPMPSILAFAHRGGMADRPENTIGAFVHAQALGVRAVETDAWITADRIAVLSHDGVVRTSAGNRPIAELQRDELPRHIPSMADLYRECGSGLDIAVDILDPAAATAVVTAAVSAGGGAPARLWLCSTSVEQLVSWRPLHPDVHLVHSDSNWKQHRGDPSAHARVLRERSVQVLNLRYRQCLPAVIAACHGNGVMLFGWGVQRVSAMRRLVRLGVDGLMSDHVDRLLTAVDSGPDRA
jgi:glycerophosphoryl diester phosphodiesterase